jgi:fatty-acyl-CoA synthase
VSLSVERPDLSNRNKAPIAARCRQRIASDIWEAFAARFAIPQILEFYAATEGNFSLFNVEGKVGALDRIPPLGVFRCLRNIAARRVWFTFSRFLL